MNTKIKALNDIEDKIAELDEAVLQNESLFDGEKAICKGKLNEIWERVRTARHQVENRTRKMGY